jgi:hypothetical protein
VVGWLLTTQRRIFLLPKSVRVVVIGNENYTHTQREKKKKTKREKWWADEEREKEENENWLKEKSWKK